MNARDQGEDLAKQFGYAHEDFTGNPEQEKKINLHNNQVGYGIGKISFGGHPIATLRVLCVQAWASGKLIQFDWDNIHIHTLYAD